MKTVRAPSDHIVHVLSFESSIPALKDKYFKQQHPAEAEAPNRFNDVYYTQGIVVTDKGIFHIDEEGVIRTKPISDEHPMAINFYLHYKDSFTLVPWATGKYAGIDLLKLVTGETVPLEKFVRSFGTRLECNYEQARDFLAGFKPVTLSSLSQ